MGATAYLGISSSSGWSVLDAATHQRSLGIRGVWGFRVFSFGAHWDKSDELNVVVNGVDPALMDDVSRRAKKYVIEDGLARMVGGVLRVDETALAARLTSAGAGMARHAPTQHETETAESGAPVASEFDSVKYFAGGGDWIMNIAPGVNLSVPDLLGESVAVLGIKGSGKTQTAAVIAEELLGSGVPMGIIDIAGEYWGLREKYPVLIAGAEAGHAVDIAVTPEQAGKLADYSLRHGESVIFDVSEYRLDDREAAVESFFEALWTAAGELRKPYVVLLEEAHNYIPQSQSSDLKKLLIQVATEGRKRGLSIIMVSQRPARIDKNVLAQAGIKFLHRAMLPNDIANYTANIPSIIMSPSEVRAAVFAFEAGEALALYGKVVKQVQVRRRHTFHAGYTPGMDAIQRPMALADADQAAKVEAVRLALGGGGVSATAGRAASTDEVAALRAQLATKDQEIARLRGMVDGSKQEIATAQAKVKQLIVENADKDTRIAELETQLDVIRARMVDGIDDADQLNAVDWMLAPAPVDVVARRMADAEKKAKRRQESGAAALVSKVRGAVGRKWQRDMLALLAARGRMTQADIIRELSISPATFSTPTLLLDAGIIKKEGRGGATVYKWVAPERIKTQYPALDASVIIAQMLK